MSNMTMTGLGELSSLLAGGGPLPTIEGGQHQLTAGDRAVFEATLAEVQVGSPFLGDTQTLQASATIEDAAPEDEDEGEGLETMDPQALAAPAEPLPPAPGAAFAVAFSFAATPDLAPSLPPASARPTKANRDEAPTVEERTMTEDRGDVARSRSTPASTKADRASPGSELEATPSPETVAPTVTTAATSAIAPEVTLEVTPPITRAVAPEITPATATLPPVLNDLRANDGASANANASSKVAHATPTANAKPIAHSIANVSAAQASAAHTSAPTANPSTPDPKTAWAEGPSPSSPSPSPRPRLATRGKSAEDSRAQPVEPGEITAAARSGDRTPAPPLSPTVTQPQPRPAATGDRGDVVPRFNLASKIITTTAPTAAAPPMMTLGHDRSDDGAAMLLEARHVEASPFDPRSAPLEGVLTNNVDPTFGLPLTQLVGPATSPGAKNVTHVVGAASPADSVRTMEPTGNTEAVRAFEALGHRRVLQQKEASGHVFVPELGRVEVRARARDAESVDVHVRADEAPAKHAIVQAAPEIRQHLQADLPHATVHVDRSTAQQAFRGEMSARDERGGANDHGQRERRDDARAEEREAVRDRRLGGVKGARARFVL